MRKLICTFLGVVICQVSAAEWRPSAALLRAVRVVESSDGQFLYGDNGRSLGAFQLSEAAWEDVSSSRRSRNLKVYSYSQHALHDYINRTYASDYISLIRAELSRKLLRAPTSGEIYAAYNMGLANFAECGYRLAKVNPVTARKCRQIHALVEKG